MRRALAITAFLALALALAGSAYAKEMSVALSAGPPGLDPGDTWNAKLLVHGEPELLKMAVPSITIRNLGSGESRTFAAKQANGKAPDGQLVYRVNVVFPSEGSWRYTLVDGFSDREYEGGTITIGTPAGAPTSAPSRPEPVAAADDGGFPVWPVASGAAAFVLLAIAAALAVRRRSPRTA
jgi:hypothetical protein